MIARHPRETVYFPSIEFVRGDAGVQCNTVRETGTMGTYDYLSEGEALNALRNFLRGIEWKRDK